MDAAPHAAPDVGTTSAPDELLDAILQVFSARGFEGASLAQLGQACNRSKASLYHHFPGGKEQMVQILIARCQLALDTEVFGPLKLISQAVDEIDEKQAPQHPTKHNAKRSPKEKKGKQAAKQQERQREAATQAVKQFVDGFYRYLQRHDGNCLLATLALTQPDLLGSAQSQQLTSWLALLEGCLEQVGYKPKVARRRAQASLARLYGSLMLTAMGSPISTKKACKWLKRDLLLI